LASEVDQWDNLTFLTKLNLHLWITKAAIVLFGKMRPSIFVSGLPHHLGSKEADGMEKDYHHFGPR
jgi:hypothetical protein